MARRKIRTPREQEKYDSKVKARRSISKAHSEAKPNLELEVKGRRMSSKMTMPPSMMGQGLMQFGRGFGPKGSNYKGYAPGDIENETWSDLGNFEETLDEAQQRGIYSAEEAKAQLVIWTELEVAYKATTDEEHLLKAKEMRTKLRRKVGSNKAQATRSINKMKAEMLTLKLDKEKEVLVGSRWTTVTWLRKDWRRRLEVYGAGPIQEVVILDPSIPVAFVRIKVEEQGSTTVRTPDWSTDRWGRKFHVYTSTRGEVGKRIGGIEWGTMSTPKHKDVRYSDDRVIVVPPKFR